MFVGAEMESEVRVLLLVQMLLAMFGEERQFDVSMRLLLRLKWTMLIGGERGLESR